ncbi:MAG: hypothetical protein JRH13_00220 [Deltaproteobacteria bacterium]|nr:hypothetical protein [Deltaproteobacteria bacterium]MBW2017062.1 hypothetical protein [Deltaproteobacteria bacterium]MBW2127774.1 hypothetical protein [Deltaproteobacteria bacterium]MBW2303166.1 hypothetical protein [Deltaproteobacteria bacterium]
MIWLLGFLVVLTQGNAANRLGISFYVDFPTILAAYLLVFVGQLASGAFAFGTGLLIDCYSGGVLGLFTTLQLLSLSAMRVGTRFFDTHSPSSIFILVGLGVWIKGVLFMSFVTAFSLREGFHLEMLKPITFSALCSGLLAPLVFFLLNRYHRKLTEARKRQVGE